MTDLWWAGAALTSMLAFSLVAWLWEQWRSRRVKGSLSIPQLSWPRLTVAAIEEGRPVVFLTARYASPEAMKNAKFMAHVVACLIGLALLDRTANWNAYDWVNANLGLLFVCLIVAYLAFHALHWLFRRVLWRIPGWQKRLTMGFAGGRIVWTNEEGNRRFLFWQRRPPIAATDERQARVVFPHRQAAEELRKVREYEAGTGKRWKKPLYYQQASEVLIDAGPNHGNWLKVAELADDIAGERAHKIVTAINIADDLARGKIEMEAKIAIKASPAPPPPRGGLFR